jgi:stearoyl-CoA desaturase (delta-9 desaturase)
MHVGCLLVGFTGVARVGHVLCLVLYVVRMFGITAGYHRYFAHRTYKTSRPFQFLLAFLGCSAMQRGPLWWAAHHRAHHRHSDTPMDPHSPVLRTLAWAHVGWIFAAGEHAQPRQPVRDLERYIELRWLDRCHWIPGLGVAAACYVFAGLAGLAWGFFVSTVLCYHATFAVNSLGHRFGARRYPTRDSSRNNAALALLTLGEGWHNNHHFYPTSANQGFAWYEVDVSYYALKALEQCGLVWDVRTPPSAVIAARLDSPARAA